MRRFLENKLENLKAYLKKLKKVAIAFSSGVDSTFLLKVAHDELKENVIALSIKADSFPEREINQAVEFCKNENIKHIVVEFDELKIEGFKSNPPNRCYLCKKALFQKMKEIAKQNNIEYILEGSNLDDESDYRPGMQAVFELGIKSPLKELRFSKNEIRILSRKLGLKTADKPSYACLASRFTYGEEITKEKLHMVDSAEQFLLDLGFYQVRVRLHDNIARIEVIPDEFEKILKNKKQITDKLKLFGFKYITLDLTGYRSGSMNEILDKK